MTQETFDNEQCKGCGHYRLITCAGRMYCCHYLLDEGHSRKRDGAKCLSYNPDGKAKRYSLDLRY